MSEDLTADPGAGGVSPLRKKISAVVLSVLVIVLVVEARAGLGHMLTGKALQQNFPEGAFGKATTMDELQSLLSLAPSRTVVGENAEEIEYRYSWFSMLRPLLNRPEAAYYVSASQTTPSYALRFNTERPTEGELNPRRPPAGDMNGGIMTPGGAGMAGMGMGGPGTGGPRMGGPGMGGGDFGPPPQDPVLAVLDKDGDGELSEDELNAASEVLLSADKDADGKLTQQELGPAANGPPVRQRPPIDDTDETPTPAVDNEPSESQPTEEKADPQAADSSASENETSESPPVVSPQADAEKETTTSERS